MLQEIVDKYLEIFPDERLGLKLLRAQLADNEQLNNRTNFHGHITGSGIVLSPDHKKVLLIHHKLFKLWQQPGGHWDAGENDEPDPLAAAKREVEEETGITIAEALSISDNPLVPIDIDSHRVPARSAKGEPAHAYHDWRYVFVASNEQLHHQQLEVNAAKWFALSDRETARITRPLKKLQRLKLV